MTRAFSSSEMASTRPEPHMPTGGMSFMVVIFIPEPFIFYAVYCSGSSSHAHFYFCTLKCRSCNCGTAEHEVFVSRTISLLVPMSTRREVLRFYSYRCILSRIRCLLPQSRICWGRSFTLTPFPLQYQVLRPLKFEAVVKLRLEGDLPCILSGDMPAKMCSMVVFPATAMLSFLMACARSLRRLV